MITRFFFALAALFGSAAAAPAAILFYEDFAEEAAALPASGGQVTNFAGLDSFTIIDGTVDLFTNGGFGLPCPSGGCLDLDGSTGAAVDMETAPFSFKGGETYTLSANIRGSRRGSVTDTVQFGIRGGGFFQSIPITLAPNDDYRVVAMPIFALIDFDASIYFDHQGGDNVGLLLDRVVLTGPDDPGLTTPIPLPAPALLLAGALALGATAARRRA